MQSEAVYKTGIRKNLNRLLRNLTDDGIIDFESFAFESLEAELVKKNIECTQIVEEILFEAVKRSACPDRHLILQLIDRFFLRFSQFRNIILNDPEEFLELMVETNPIHNPLPGLKKDGKKLKAEAIRVIKGWEKKFMKADARMKCIVVTLKKTKFVDYDKLDTDFEAERIRKEKIAERKKIMLQNTLTAYRSKFEEIKKVSDNLTIELETILKILVPSFVDDFDLTILTQFPSKVQSDTTSAKNLNILIADLNPEIVVSSENDALVEAFLDTKLLLIHRVQTLRKLAKRLQVLKKPGEELAQTIIGYRDGLKKLVLKAESLNLKGNLKMKKEEKRKKKFDDDFIDVEMSIDDILMVQYSKLAEEAMEKEKEEECSESADNITVPVKKTSSPIKSVPFGLDLKYWGEEREKVQIPKNNADCHRFWRAAEEGTSSGTAQQNIYTQRQFTFVGEAPKSDKVCQARLPNGSLCPRRDFYSCPLHGIIVDRDEQGNAITKNGRDADNHREERKRRKEAEEFARQIEKQHEKKRKKKHDVESTPSEDVRLRLHKKLLDPKTVARVSAVLDASRKNRLQKNFGQQFSHF
uniref:UV-stimulated scaffold protein A C-terminal domain-containing protein n=1 Tax=Caenorhabditis japonica TaxID=281687 RepID=A0A8R1DEC7_CAEJA